MELVYVIPRATRQRLALVQLREILPKLLVGPSGEQLLMTQLEPAAMARLFLFTNDLNIRK